LLQSVPATPAGSDVKELGKTEQPSVRVYSLPAQTVIVRDLDPRATLARELPSRLTLELSACLTRESQQEDTRVWLEVIY
jgi:hypothetical protein